MNPIVAGIWWVMLAATLLVVVPIVLALLSRALAAARFIERYTAEILDSGGGIARNTSHVPALQETISVAGSLLAGAASIEQHTAGVAAALAVPRPRRATPGR